MYYVGKHEVEEAALEAIRILECSGEGNLYDDNDSRVRNQIHGVLLLANTIEVLSRREGS